MTVSVRGFGTNVNTGGNSTATPALPTRVAGDKLLLLIATGTAASDEPTVTTGWTKVGTHNNTGAPAFGLDAGPRRVTVYERIATNDTADAATVTSGGAADTGRVLSAIIGAYTKTDAEWAPTQWGSGGSTTAQTTTISIPVTTTWQLDVQDLLVTIFAGVPDTNGMGNPTVTWTGLTGTALTSRINSASGGGNDARWQVADRSISGTSSGSGSFGASVTSATYGSVGFIRLRDQAAAAAPARTRNVITSNPATPRSYSW